MPPPDPDPWTVLGVPPGADARAVRAAHRALARRHHPDLHPGDPAAEDAMRRINAAWRALGGDPGGGWVPPLAPDPADDEEPVPIVLAPLARRGPGLVAVVLAIVLLLVVGTAFAGDPARNRRPAVGPTGPRVGAASTVPGAR